MFLSPKSVNACGMRIPVFSAGHPRSFFLHKLASRRCLFVSSLLALVAAFTSSAIHAAQPAAPIVTTTSGIIRGLNEGTVLSLKGIPYAVPPTGEQRWAPPAPATPWKGTLDATSYRNGCPQVARYSLTQAGYEEDCLFINVTVPNDGKPANAKRPVFVWIYGGAFVGGSSALYPLTDLALAGDAVVVSFNYRLGVLGFMAHPSFEASANGAYGREDQREALRWVQRNIAAFGGDPARVTIGGESAGAASACMHIIAPKETKGLLSDSRLLAERIDLMDAFDEQGVRILFCKEACEIEADVAAPCSPSVRC